MMVPFDVRWERGTLLLYSLDRRRASQVDVRYYVVA